MANSGGTNGTEGRRTAAGPNGTEGRRVAIGQDNHQGKTKKAMDRATDEA